MLPVWIAIAATVLLASIAAHLSTFFGIDPMDVVPGVMFIHVAIFPPFFAAILYARKAAGTGKGAQGLVLKQAPRWLRLTTSIFFAYAFINFALFFFHTSGGSPEHRNGGYELRSHGRLIREITEQEYHLQRAYVVRGFSGHWMLFSSAAITFLVGSKRMLASKQAFAVQPWPLTDRP
jgi:hypothetical protein